jgi:hypothetical protein
VGKAGDNSGKGRELKMDDGCKPDSKGAVAGSGSRGCLRSLAYFQRVKIREIHRDDSFFKEAHQILKN